MVKPRDQFARARFASELDRNFSVVASAGSGKTTAITQRVLSIARSPNAADTLPHLVVVTFTNRAADEMQQRTRQALLEENLRQEVQTAFNRAFFGTIHSFCMKLLTDFGHYLGLPAPLELVKDDDDLWQEFAQNQTRIGRSLGDKDRAMLLRFVQARDLMELARRAGSAALRVPPPSSCPILDEAQDTEPLQFSVLLEATRPPAASGLWLQDRHLGPRPGHFCMVGDFQQSIYWQRADLNYYRAVHEALVGDEHGESLEFAVTFRLDQKQLAFVNETFREILNNKDGQVRFVELQPRPGILPGKVIRMPLVAKELLPEGKKLKDYQKARIEGEYLARWIRDTGLKKLSADSWREVAILCPRKAWLQTTAAALRRVGLPVAIQSENDVKGDSPAYAWLTALLTIMTDPLNAYEIVGVLREIFGASDHDLAVFSDGQRARFRIDEILSATGRISSLLRTLAEIRQRAEGLALFDAVTLIIEQTQLRQRLLVLPAAEFGDLARELDALLAQTAEAEANGMILAEFAEHLRNDFATQRAVRFSADDNAIQLITSYKAKGAEWQAVIVPFLARELRPHSPPYPHFVKSPVDGELIIAFGKQDKSKDLKDAIERAQKQELERLLYVATTRARHALVIVLDQEIFTNNDGQDPRTAQLRRLIRDKDSYSGEFDQHSSTIDDVLEPSPIAGQASQKNGAEIQPLTDGELKRAAKRASEFVRKITPSALDSEVPVDVQTRGGLDTLATLYGCWWHKFFQRLDWKAVAEITGLEVEAGLFSTALGHLLLYSAEELQVEWRRLEQLPPAQLENEIRLDAADGL